MVGLWLTLIGFVFLLFLTTGIFVYFLGTSLNTHDAKKVDPLPKIKQ